MSCIGSGAPYVQVGVREKVGISKESLVRLAQHARIPTTRRRASGERQQARRPEGKYFLTTTVGQSRPVGHAPEPVSLGGK